MNNNKSLALDSQAPQHSLAHLGRALGGKIAGCAARAPGLEGLDRRGIEVRIEGLS